MLFFLLVTLQSPKPPPEEPDDPEEEPDPQAAVERASARAPTRARERLSCMEECLFLVGRDGRGRPYVDCRFALNVPTVKDIRRSRPNETRL
jgi:hypothetical protein